MRHMQAIIEGLLQMAQSNDARHNYIRITDVLMTVARRIENDKNCPEEAVKGLTVGPFMRDLLSQGTLLASHLDELQRDLNEQSLRNGLLQVQLYELERTNPDAFELARLRKLLDDMRKRCERGLKKMEKLPQIRELQDRVKEGRNRRADLEKDLKDSQDEVKRLTGLLTQEEKDPWNRELQDLYESRLPSKAGSGERDPWNRELQDLYESRLPSKGVSGSKSKPLCRHGEPQGECPGCDEEAKTTAKCSHPPHYAVESIDGYDCTKCGARGFESRFCPSSPDRDCHYHTQGGMVELASGREVPPPAGHRVDKESFDSCIYCGQPEERK